ncbi:hypothetical protein ACFW04_014694 [Cataglyphis niger]
MSRMSAINLKCAGCDTFLKKTTATHKYCYFSLLSSNLITIPEKTRISAYFKKNIYISCGNRCCKSYLIKNKIYEEDLGFLREHSNTVLRPGNSTIPFFCEFSKVMETLSIKHDSTLLDKISEYSISEEQLHVFTRLNWENLNTIKDMLISLRNKLKNEHDVSEYFNSIIKFFKNDVLSLRFDINSLNRDDLIQNHTTKMSKKVFNVNDNLFLICDGTYKRKKVRLCKPFTLCTTDSYIVDMLRPYFANQNNAKILKSVGQHPQRGLPKSLPAFALRPVGKKSPDGQTEGGRNNILEDILEHENFRVLMPALKGKRKQLSTEESNESRFVIKICWSVEFVHGVLKQKYQLLDYKIDKLIPKIRSYFRIASFLNNTFGKRFHSDLPFKSVTSDDILDFPEMTERDLKILFTGSYQLDQTVLFDRNVRQISVKCTQIESSISSYFSNSIYSIYKCFLRYKSNSVHVSDLTHYTCECANEKRSVGCCSHIAAIVYYLSHARYLSKIFKPMDILSKIFKKNNYILVIESDSNKD